MSSIKCQFPLCPHYAVEGINYCAQHYELQKQVANMEDKAQ